MFSYFFSALRVSSAIDFWVAISFVAFLLAMALFGFLICLSHHYGVDSAALFYSLPLFFIALYS